MKKILKVTCFILANREVAVFEHPTAGIQFPAGTVESGESLLEAARREAYEEVGAKMFGGRIVGLHLDDPGRAFVAWELAEQPRLAEFCDTDGHRFRPFWMAFDDVAERIHPLQRDWWRFAPSSWSTALRFQRLESSVVVRAMTPDDYPKMADWMTDERVLEWYGGQEHRMELERVVQHYGSRVEGDEPVYPAIIEYQGRAVGYLQYYPITTFEAYGLQEVGDPWALDLFIGEPGLWGMGIGSEAIRTVLEYLRIAGVAEVYIDPKTTNHRAIRAYEKCGFEKVCVLENRIEEDGRHWDAVILRCNLEDEPHP